MTLPTIQLSRWNPEAIKNGPQKIRINDLKM